MKPFLFAAVLLALPAAAQAQVAAGTVPNTFDGPAARPPAARPGPAAAPATPRPAAALSQTRANANSEAVLRNFIRGAQSGRIDYSS